MTKEEDAQNPSETSSASESKETTNKYAIAYRKVYRFFGFNKGYNFPLWVIFAGGMLGFSLSRLADLDYDGYFKRNFALVPGYWYYFHSGSYRYGMLIHLAAILPAGILMTFQFTPIIRHKWMLFHRLNGYVVLLLCLISNASAFVVIRHKQGGNRINSHAVETLMGILTTIGIFMGWWNIRRKQIEQHRAWMLRTMFYMAVTITARVINFAARDVITKFGNYWAVWTCDEINFLYLNLGMQFPRETYPECILSDGSLDRWKRVAVAAWKDPVHLERFGASSVAPFSTMLWICLFLHMIGVELYLRMTPRETERLRQISYEKQVEAGYKNPGSAGLVLDPWIDGEKWTPKR